MNTVKKNLIFQTFYQILIVITPLITSPYVSRVLGAEGLGIYSYTYSIANYFMIVAMLGTNTYGSKIIATVRDDKEERSRVYSEIVALQMLLTVVGTCIYVGYILVVKQEDLLVSCIQTLMIVSCLFKVDWFFFGLEEFKTTVTRNVIIKILAIAAIFIFVRQEGDLWKYVLILAGGEVISQLFLFVRARRYLVFIRPTIKGMLGHVKPNLILFVPGIAFALNNDLDKTMIGIFSDYSNTGYYYNADKLIKIPQGIITGVGTVMLPYMTNMVAHDNGNNNGVKFFKHSFMPISMIIFALAGGIIAICEDFVPVFFGDGYEPCIILINILAVAMIFKSVANVIRTQYLIPNNKDKSFSAVILGGAIFNCVLNVALIIPYGAIGASIATLIAETAVCIGHIWLMQKDVNIIPTLLRCVVFIVPCTVMYVVIKLISNAPPPSGILGLGLEILIGGCVYLIIAIPLGMKLSSVFKEQVTGICNKVIKQIIRNN